MDNFSYISNADPSYIDELYKNYLKDPHSVDISWKKFFEGYDFSLAKYGDNGGSAIATEIPETFLKEANVLNLIRAYRQRGHLFTKTNPVRERREYKPTLELHHFNLSDEDLDTVFQAGVNIGIGSTKLSDIIAHLQQTYCQSVGAEYMFIRQPEVVEWLRQKMETTKNTPDFSIDEKKHILRKLNEAVTFEQFLHTKFVGQKRFSLEGCETLIPALDAVIQKGSDLGIEEFVIGMAHRGRLNVLANTLHKSYEEIFAEFESRPYEDSLFDGDVKYHMGFSSDVTTASGKKVHLCLAANPSHLEAVDPVAEGMARAKLDVKYDYDNNRIAAILIHGDASIAGQGVVYEVIQMSQLDGYKTGGTIHIVINNQIGFTTNYLDGRSSTYCTDVAKVTQSPVFHVNADDVEAIVFTIQLAMEFRQKFHRDVFIDLLGYRKHGHNESDEPKFTQPVLYKAIAKHPNPKEIYKQKLKENGNFDATIAQEIEAEFKNLLQKKLNKVKTRQHGVTKVEKTLNAQWSNLRIASEKDFEKSPPTGVDTKTLNRIGAKMLEIPSDVKVFKKIERLFEKRRNMFKENKLDWALGELLAYGTLVDEGYNIRFSGQDVERGTFSHRHAVVKLEDSDEEFIPLQNISLKQAPFNIYNSLLSEYAVLGFEYGYSSVSPNSLVIWEAQFGDFVNGAQIIIDQFISSAEDKWMRQNGLTMFLPHGYEGQGSEHSSARLERFLSLCSGDNMQIVNCTTPANFFHVLRRQMHREFRKPLIVFTPKSLLRHPSCISDIDEFAKGGFKEVIDDNLIKNAGNITRVLFCNGKIYYDLLAKRDLTPNPSPEGEGNKASKVEGMKESDSNKTAIVRIEQLYPFPLKQLKTIISKYKAAKEWFWVQEEPENMGAWSFMLRTFKEVDLQLISRHESASPATGSSKQHAMQQEEILNRAFDK